MTAKDLITDKIPPLKTSDTGQDALGVMDEFRVSHLPIINNEELLGVVSDEDIFANNHVEEPIGNHNLSLSHVFVTEDQHLLEVLRVMSEKRLTLLPVVDKKNKFAGVITLRTLVEHFSKFASVSSLGAVIILEVNTKDYNLSQIAQIVESNDASILSMFILSNPDSTRLDVILKLNKMDISAVLATFNRYDYIIKATFSESQYDDYLQDRFDSLMSYLNV